MENNNFSGDVPEITEFWQKKHVKYLQRCLDILPESLSSLEVSRLTIAFFAISGLDLLDALDTIDTIKPRILEWIYSLQVLPDKQDDQTTSRCGFRGSTANGFITRYDEHKQVLHKFDGAHIAMTYTGLASLIILGDDLSKVNKDAVLQSLRELQHPNGSFQPLLDDSENDMRFVYCATIICYILNSWTGMDVEKTVNYVKDSFTYEGGIGQGPGLEAHGGSTYCAVASLVLLGRLQSTFTVEELEKLRKWCLFKQENGFQGRPNKPPDTCYSFWVGATLKLLDAYHYVDFQQNTNFLLSTQDPITGGMSKYPDNIPDPLHTCLGIAGLSLMDFPDLQGINPALNMSKRAVKHLENLHNSSSFVN